EGKVLSVFDPHAFLRAQTLLLGHAPKFMNNWSYPPQLLPWILGFGLMPYRAAFALWTAATFGLYAFAVCYRRPYPAKLTLLLLLAPASFVNLIDGQNGFLIAALLVGGLRLLDTRPVAAGILFGLATVKPQLMPSVPVLLLCGRHWRATAAAILTTALMVGLSIALFGAEAWLAYIRETIPYQTHLLERAPAADHYGIAASFVTIFMGARILGGSLAVAYGLSAVAALAALWLVIRACLRAPSAEIRNAFLLAATFIATPYAHVYDLPLLNAALVMLLADAATKDAPPTVTETLAIGAIWLLPLYAFHFNRLGLPLAPLSLVAFAAMLWLRLRRACRTA
ncbi:MAG: DUF2029 domain-containing protein, partial [Alphaproteobacteria bacterium]|nr:DUF2029 domain-containing protein [Alphaproteobacteria bacterium]